MKKKTYFLLILTSSILLTTHLKINAQNENAEKQNNFLKMRNNDFTKLIGGIQEGAKLNYNSEKTNIEGSGAIEIKSPLPLLLQGAGSIGTTTNLSSLFDQNTLPTFSGNLTLHYLIKGLSYWFYDGSFSNNFTKLKNSNIATEDISTKINPKSETEDEIFKYKENLREKIANGKIKETDKLYTFKSFVWFSVTAKYENSKYSFYDQSRIFSEQIYEPLYNSWTGKATINGYLFWNKSDIKWKRIIGWRPNFIYLNISAQYGLGNNIHQLKKITINDITSTTIDGTSTRQTIKSQTAYNGVFKEFNTLTPSFEFIFSPIKSFAINILGDYNIINKNDKTKYNIDNFGSIATGIYFYGNGTSSKINIGAFYKWTKDNLTDSWTEQIGLKTTIPITPLD